MLHALALLRSKISACACSVLLAALTTPICHVASARPVFLGVFQWCSSGGYVPIDAVDDRDDEGPTDDDCGSGRASSSNPVDLQGGTKLERMVDLKVPLAGRHFSLIRTYTSDTRTAGTVDSFPPRMDYVDNGIHDGPRDTISAKWHLSSFSMLEYNANTTVGGTSPGTFGRIRLLGSARQFSLFLAPNNGFGRTTKFHTGGPSTEYFERIETSVSSPATLSSYNNHPVFRLLIPGEVERMFYRAAYVTTDIHGIVAEESDGSVGAEQWKWGKLAQERDMYGNTFDYDWELVAAVCEPDEETPSDWIVRLRGIRCITSDGKLQAEIAFDYHFIDADTDEYSDHPLFGRLKAVRVLRPLAEQTDLRSVRTADSYMEGNSVEVQRVEYTYFDDVHQPTMTSSETCPDTWTAATGNELGSTGDLVQVAQVDRVDGADYDEHPGVSYDARCRVTQYRYYAEAIGAKNYQHCNEAELFHAADWTSSGVGGDLDGYKHQLKLVIQPEQVELYARAINEASTRAALMTRASELLQAGYASMFTFDESTRKVIDLAAKIIIYEATNGDLAEKNRVQRQYLSAAGCGCAGAAGGSSLSLMEKYTYLGGLKDTKLHVPGWLAGTTDPSNGYLQTTVVEEFAHDGDMDPDDPFDMLYRTRLYDFANFRDNTSTTAPRRTPYLINEVIKDTSSPANYWVTHHVRKDSGGNRELIRTMSPSVMSSYAPATSTSGPDYAAKTNAGFVTAYTYNMALRPELVLISGDGVNTLSMGPANDDFAWDSATTKYSAVSKTEYSTTWPDLPASVERYKTGNTSNTDVIERTEFHYVSAGVTSLGRDLVSIETWIRPELVAENGPTTTWLKSAVIFDGRGQQYLTFAADGAATRFYYAGMHGQPTSIVQNFDTSTLSFTGLTLSTTGRHGDGGTLTTSYGYDPLGRTVSQTGPGGVATYTRRELRSLDGSALSYYCEIALPPRDDQGTGTEADDTYPFGPADLAWSTAGGQPLGANTQSIGSGGYSIYSGSPTGYNPLVQSVSLDSTLLAKSRMERSISGLGTSSKVWHDTSGNTSAHYYETKYVHDAKGRQVLTKNPVDTYTEYAYDVLDRIVAEFTGTSPTNLVQTRAFYFDGGSFGSGAPGAGVGDGNLTGVKEWVDGSNTRVTEHAYDGRNRRIATKAPAAPHQTYLHDNLDRLVERAEYGALPSSLTNPTSSPTNRTFLSRNLYNRRGLVYTQERAIDPDASSPSFLAGHTWFDAVGRPIATSGPNAPAQKTAYDGLGRAAVTYRTDRGGDAAPGASGNHADAASVSGDVILEQTNSIFLGSGQVGHLVHRQRVHDATVTGALTSSSDAIATWTGHLYDKADRLVKRVEFGTYDTSTDVFKGNVSAPSLSPLPGTGELVSETVYGARGLVEREVSPDGQSTKYVYDDMNRRVGVIENHVDGSISRSGTPAWGWEVSLGSNPANADEDRATITTYDGMGNVTYLVAGTYDTTNSVVDYQATQYVYGVVPTGETPPTLGVAGSTLFSNDLLARVIYPDGDTSNDNVRYTYNRLGELTTMVDQNATAHAYTRDALGRVTQDAVTNFGGGISNVARKQTFAFDSAGLRTDVRTLGASDAVLNAVRFRYDGLWNVTQVIQNPLGDINELSPPSSQGTVDVTYATAAASSGNRSRLSKYGYPTNPGGAVTRTELEYMYGTTSGLNDVISRPQELRWAGPDGSGSALVDKFAKLDYLGASTFVRRYVGDYASSTHRHLFGLDRFITPTTGAKSPGEYHGIDRFGRVKRQLWAPTNPAGNWDPTDGGVSMHSGVYAPAIFDFAYTYDAESNPLARYDRRANDRVSWADRDEHYTYDGLDRLIQADRGRYNHAGSPPTFTNGGKRGQQWELDPLGNWKKFRVNVTGDGSFTDNGDTVDVRTFNLVNEIVTRSLKDAELGTQPPPPTAVPLAPAYDPAGNMTSRPRLLTGTSTADWTLKYDAWNRLVHVKVGSDDRAAYGYYGTHWRAWRVADNNADTTIDQANAYYYDASWRLLEERIDESHTPGGGWAAPAVPASIPTDVITQRVWGLEYIDELVYFHTDGSAGSPSDGDFEDASGYYALVDRLYSVIGVADASDGDLIERIRYTPYGVARVVDVAQAASMGDVNGDGKVDFYDFNAAYAALGGELKSTTSSYDPDVDFNGDNTVSFSEYNLVLGNFGQSYSVPAEAQLSLQTIANTIGYAGYIFDPAVELYCTRTRWHDSQLGQWLSRDRLPYVDSPSLYLYCLGIPTKYTDPSGESPALGAACAACLSAALGACAIQCGLDEDWPGAPRGYGNCMVACLKALPDWYIWTCGSACLATAIKYYNNLPKSAPKAKPPSTPKSPPSPSTPAQPAPCGPAAPQPTLPPATTPKTIPANPTPNPYPIAEPPLTPTPPWRPDPRWPVGPGPGRGVGPYEPPPLIDPSRGPFGPLPPEGPIGPPSWWLPRPPSPPSLN